MWPHCCVLCVERSMCWNPGSLLAEEAWAEPERRWLSLSEPQSLYLRGTSILWKDGNSCLGRPAAVLGELWGEQVTCLGHSLSVLEQGSGPRA